MSKDSKSTEAYRIKARLDECNYQIHQIEERTGLGISTFKIDEDGYHYPTFGIMDSLGGRFYKLRLRRYDSQSLEDHFYDIRQVMDELRQCCAAREEFLSRFQDSWDHLPAYDPAISVCYNLRNVTLVIPIELLVKYQVHFETGGLFAPTFKVQKIRGCYVACMEFTWCELAWRNFDCKVGLLSWKIEEYQKQKKARMSLHEFNEQCVRFGYCERAIFTEQEPKKSNQHKHVMRSGIPILQRPNATYSSYRTTRGEDSLLAQCHDDTFEKKLEELHGREQALRQETEIIALPCQRAGNCLGRRECLRLSFLPLVSSVREGQYCYILRYGCFQLGEMVRMQDLSNLKYISVLTAYRLTVSLLTLIDRLVRMKVLLRLSPDNLLVDLDSSFVLPIDWSGAKLLDYMPVQFVLLYYRQVARIVMRLAGAYRENDGAWKLPIGDSHSASSQLAELFALLQQLDQKIELPSDLDETMILLSKFYDDEQQLITSLSESILRANPESGQLPYELIDRN